MHYITLYYVRFNPFPDDKILDWSKFKSFADDIKKKLLKMMIFVFDRVKKHWGRGVGVRRICWLPAFSPFPSMCSKGFLIRVVKSRDCVVKSFKLRYDTLLHATHITCTLLHTTLQRVDSMTHRIQKDNHGRASGFVFTNYSFIFQLREYPCNITHDISFLIYNGYF